MPFSSKWSPGAWRRLIGLLLVCGGLALNSGSAFAQQLAIVSQDQAVQDERPLGAQRFVLHSARLEREVTVEITAPAAPIAPGEKVAALYVLDRGYMLEGPSMRLLTASGTMAPAYVIAVSSVDPGADREADLMHAKAERNGVSVGGRADAFEAFLVQDLRPFVEARYPIDSKRSVLFGHSLGGLFAATILVNRPDEFSAYLIASPSIWANPSLIEKARAAAPHLAGKRVFIASGDQEPASERELIHRFAEALQAPGANLATQEVLYPGQNHYSSYLMAAPMAFGFLLPPAKARP